MMKLTSLLHGGAAPGPLESSLEPGILCEPTVERYGGWRVFFFSNEGSEPPHVHVESGEKWAKFWLNPVELADSEGFNV